MSIEIERKFLLNSLPEDYRKDAIEILQGYLLICEDGQEVRVRKKGEIFLHTIKKPLAEGRTEIEIEISEVQFNKLWAFTKGRRLEKTRYHYLLNHGLVAEIDVYKGKNAGLTVVEVEFKTREELINFAKPEWFGQEITGEKKYKNQNLAS